MAKARHSLVNDTASCASTAASTRPKAACRVPRPPHDNRVSRKRPAVGPILARAKLGLRLGRAPDVCGGVVQVGAGGSRATSIKAQRNNSTHNPAHAGKLGWLRFPAQCTGEVSVRSGSLAQRDQLSRGRSNSRWHKTELERRRADLEMHSAAGIWWENVRSRVRAGDHFHSSNTEGQPRRHRSDLKWEG